MKAGLNDVPAEAAIGLTADSDALSSIQTILPSLSILHDYPDLQHLLRERNCCLHIKLDDVEHANLLPHLGDAIAFIQDALNGEAKVLVHCAAGISRSATASCPRSLCVSVPPIRLALKQSGTLDT